MSSSSRSHLLVPSLLLLGALAVLGCRSVYYSAMEQIGTHKRHILRDRVVAAQGEQREAEEQFQTSYERFKEVTGFSGGDLEEAYANLAGELEESEDKADAVRDRIESIEQVASDLFEEWEGEIPQIQSSKLRASSADSLQETKGRYAVLIAAMKRAEKKMDPVLAAFRDQVLFLKHNLNAQAISSLEGSVSAIEDDVAALIAEIRASIAESDRFLATLGASG